MAEAFPIRIIFELPNRPEDVRLRDAYRDRDENLLRTAVDERLGIRDVPYRILEFPSLAFAFKFGPDVPARRDLPELRRHVEARLRGLVLILGFSELSRARAFLGSALERREMAGVDVPIAPYYDSWCPGESAPPRIFNTRAAAEELIRKRALTVPVPALEGDGVNLVVVDRGFSQEHLNHLVGGFNYPGGWIVQPPGEPAAHMPGAATPGEHGTMVARNALALAPLARLFDLPMLPERITNVLDYIGWAHVALLWVLAEIEVWLGAEFPGPWVFSHAWGIYDRRLELIPGNYTGNPAHLFNQLIHFIDEDLGHDQIFAAGNCGQFCANPRCGPADKGPGQSILGASSHPRVLTVGAVRADGLWLGYSSQGPGQPGFLPLQPGGGAFVRKPDLCAPSHFVESADAHFLSSGTSAACGTAAGAVAALRGNTSPIAGFSCEAMRERLRQTAKKPAGAAPGWHDPNHRRGSGILDLGAALGQPAMPYPSTIPALVLPPPLPPPPAPLKTERRGVVAWFKDLFGWRTRAPT